MKMNHAATLTLAFATLAGTALAQQGPVPQDVPHLDHVFVIMMENHGYKVIAGNPNMPFTNKYTSYANHSTNYFAVAHPSLTNYLEVVGGSNFGVLDDNSPDWHNKACKPNIFTGTPNLESSSNNICPIAGTGTDAATPAIDFSNETSGPPGDINIDGVKSIAAKTGILGKTIADQLVAAGKSYKSYQESLPIGGADLVNNSDGYFSNLTDFTKIIPVLNPPLTSAGIVNLYAVKHNPFVYFQSTQEGWDAKNSLKNTVAFEGAHGLYADLASGHVPSYSFIVPNQCHDQHGRGNAGPYCNYDPSSNDTQAGLNPALIQLGDFTIQRVVTSIKSSPTWQEGHNAIVVLWDENDYATAPETNKVLLIVDTNYGVHHATSNKFYTHYSLLKTIEGGFHLPCLNHACDDKVDVMSDLFSADGDKDHDDGFATDDDN